MVCILVEPYIGNDQKQKENKMFIKNNLHLHVTKKIKIILLVYFKLK
jgi:hypothetical protein